MLLVRDLLARFEEALETSQKNDETFRNTRRDEPLHNFYKMWNRRRNAPIMYMGEDEITHGTVVFPPTDIDHPMHLCDCALVIHEELHPSWKEYITNLSKDLLQEETVSDAIWALFVEFNTHIAPKLVGMSFFAPSKYAGYLVSRPLFTLPAIAEHFIRPGTDDFAAAYEVGMQQFKLDITTAIIAGETPSMPQMTLMGMYARYGSATGRTKEKQKKKTPYSKK